MRKYIAALLMVGVLLLTGCQSNQAPIERVNALMDMTLYNVDSDISMEELGMFSQEIRDMYISWAAQSLAEFLMKDDEASVDEDTVPFIDPRIYEMSEALINKMHETATYKTKIMTLGRDSATVKISLYAMDMQQFFTGYMEFLVGVNLEADQDEILQQANESYKNFIAGIIPSSEPIEFYVELQKTGDSWRLGDASVIVYQVYTALTGN